MDPIQAAAVALIKAAEGNNVPLTFNLSKQWGVVFVYSGEGWEDFSPAIRQTVDAVQERRLARGTVKA